MQHRTVALIADATEHGALLRCGLLAQNGDCLIGMAGKDNLISAECLTASRIQAMLATIASNGGNRCVDMDAVFRVQLLADGLDIGSAASGHSAPDHLILQSEQAVIDVEADKVLRRESEHFGDAARPDRGTHGQDMLLLEPLAIAITMEILTECYVGQATIGEIFRCLFVEPQQVAQHTVITWLDQVPPLAEDAIQPIAGIFNSAIIETDPE